MISFLKSRKLTSQLKLVSSLNKAGATTHLRRVEGEKGESARAVSILFIAT